MIDLLRPNGQLFFTTHNADILDMNLPKHSFTFLRKDITYFTYCKRQKRCTKDEIFENIPDQRVQFTDLLEDQERAFQIHRFLHEMKDPYKEVFTLRVFGELPFEKIAILFGKSSGWARVTYYRARKQILDFMEGIEHG